MNFKLVIISSLILSSCSTVALEEKNAFDLDSLDENRKFELFLSDDWEKYLSNNPLFATYTGDKRQNNKINPNTVDPNKTVPQNTFEDGTPTSSWSGAGRATL